MSRERLKKRQRRHAGRRFAVIRAQRQEVRRLVQWIVSPEGQDMFKQVMMPRPMPFAEPVP